MRSRHPLVSLLLLAAVGSAQAGDPQEGKILVDKNCYSCHGNEIYTRSARKVTSLAGLSTQVQRCELALGLRWFDDQIENAATYLNENYYHFK